MVLIFSITLNVYIVNGFWDPGRLPNGWTTETLKQMHESVPTNPAISIIRTHIISELLPPWRSLLSVKDTNANMSQQRNSTNNGARTICRATRLLEATFLNRDIQFS